jgi:tRNA A-37 threonylcarbamoyl transferase component Bud32/TolB-like protein
VPDLERRLQKHLGTSHAIQSELGGGGMSRVFVAEDVALGRRVVVKVLNPALAATVSIARFQREIMFVAKLNHPNIVPVLTAGEVDGLPYFIMPYIEGESLRGRIVRGPLSLRETAAILKDATRALAYAHSQGVVHRDIKPDNILLAGSAAVVTDFGVAKAVSAARDRGIRSGGEAITGIGISLGTPQYMAPEQAAADPNADLRVDLYALGIVAYEMLVGSPPFHGRTPQALLAAQLTELPPPLSSRRYDVPVALSDLVMKCLEKDPADRPRTAGEVLSVLDSADAIAGPVAAPPRAVATRRRNKWKAWIATAVPLITVAALFAFALWPTVRDTPPATATPARSAVIRIPPADSIGPGSGQLATAISAAIETALVRSGLNVITGAATTNPAPASFVVQTTVQRVGQRARANVRIVAERDSAIWADQMDFRIDSSFAAQDSIGARVVRAARDAAARFAQP